MILLHEKIKAYQSKRDNFLNQIKDNFDTFYDDKHNDLNNIIGFINYSDVFFEELIKSKSLDDAAQHSINIQNESIEKVVRTYNIDAYFNKSKADKWLVNALLLVVMNANTFDGCFFTNGKDKVLKGNILKK